MAKNDINAHLLLLFKKVSKRKKLNWTKVTQTHLVTSFLLCCDLLIIVLLNMHMHALFQFFQQSNYLLFHFSQLSLPFPNTVIQKTDVIYADVWGRTLALAGGQNGQWVCQSTMCSLQSQRWFVRYCFTSVPRPESGFFLYKS